MDFFYNEVGKPITNYDNLFLDLFILNKVYTPEKEAQVKAWFKTKQDSLISLTGREAYLGRFALTASSTASATGAGKGAVSIPSANVFIA